MKDERLLTLTDAGEMLDREASGLRRAVLSGDLPATKYGKTWLVKESDLLKWHQANPRSNAGRPRAGSTKGKK